MDDFERELRQSFERRPAPPSLKRKIMERRRRASEQHGLSVVWQRLAACLMLAALLGGAAEWGWHIREERRQGEAARQQVLTALRITSRALDHMNVQLAAHDRTQE